MFYVAQSPHQRNMAMKALLLLLSAFVFVGPVAIGRDVERLAKQLLGNYMPYIPPDFPVNLTFSTSVICAQHESSSRFLKLMTWEIYEWTDERLAWMDDESFLEFQSIRTLKLPAHQIWKPDIRLYSAVEPSERDEEVNVVMLKDGRVTWWSPVVHYIACSTDATPGILNCKMKYGSWVYDNTEIVLISKDEMMDQYYLDDVGCLSISNLILTINVKYYECCPEGYTDALVTFKVEVEEDTI